jgi:glycine cleavage system H protein
VNIPDDRRYTEQHEWAYAEGDEVRVGITDYAQEALGDVVYVDFAAVSGSVEAGDVIAEVESTKSVAEVYAPISGTIAGINTELSDHPELVNQDPYGAGWFVLMVPEDARAVEGLFDASAYEALVE